MIDDPIQVEIDPDMINEVYLPYLDCQSTIQIFYGGSSSGKSYFLAQRVVIDILKGGRNYLICRAVGKAIKKSVYNEIQKLIKDWGIGALFSTHKTDMVITCGNGYQIMFSGLDDTEKLKSITPEKGVITDIWIEEATEITADNLKDMKKRLRGIDIYSDDEPAKKRITLSFNPIIQTHWIYTEFFINLAWSDQQTEYQDDDLSILKTIYKDNVFLTDDDIELLENEDDEYYYNVYTLGLWGVLGDVIFTNYEVVDLSAQIDQFDNYRNGLDFGYANDPVAFIQTHFDKKRKIIYVVREYYELELFDEDLAEEIKPLVGRDPVLCDSAEPKSIAKLKSLGIKATGAKKEKDSIRYGIKWLRGCQIKIHKDCIQFKREIQQYQWKKNKYGESMSVPVDKNDHGIDALRYAYSLDMENKKKPGFVKVRGL